MSSPWRSMDSAPKDGSYFLIERSDWSSSSIGIAFWHDGQNTPGWVHADYKQTPVDLRYYNLWAPLPAPPGQEQEGASEPCPTCGRLQWPIA